MIDPRPILDAANMLELAREVTKLHRVGFDWYGLCPFHGGRGFHIHGERFHCFSCGEKGDAIHFIRKLHGLSFREACEMILPGSTTESTVRYADPMDNPVLRDVAFGKTDRRLRDYLDAWPWSALPREGPLPERASVRTARGMSREAESAWLASCNAWIARA